MKGMLFKCGRAGQSRLRCRPSKIHKIGMANAAEGCRGPIRGKLVRHSMADRLIAINDAVLAQSHPASVILGCFVVSL